MAEFNGRLIINQIIEEQLAFPSGTATAQLISVLHDIPPPGTGRSDDTLRHRRGYRALQSEENGQSEEVTIESIEEEQSQEERDAVRKEGWLALGGSFTASAFMTVIILADLSTSSLIYEIPSNSCWLTFFLWCFRSPSSVATSRKTGCGHLHLVYLTLDKV